MWVALDLLPCHGCGHVRTMVQRIKVLTTQKQEVAILVSTLEHGWALSS